MIKVLLATVEGIERGENPSANGCSYVNNLTLAQVIELHDIVWFNNGLCKTRAFCFYENGDLFTYGEVSLTNVKQLFTLDKVNDIARLRELLGQTQFQAVTEGDMILVFLHED